MELVHEGMVNVRPAIAASGSKSGMFLMPGCSVICGFGVIWPSCERDTPYAVWTRLGRNTPLFEDKIVIFGHTPTHHYNHEYPMAIWHGRNRIGIDCGCAWGTDGRLGCLRLDDMQEFYSEEGV